MHEFGFESGSGYRHRLAHARVPAGDDQKRLLRQRRGRVLAILRGGHHAPSSGRDSRRDIRVRSANSGSLAVGIEPPGLQTVDRKHPLSEMLWYRDPRFKNLIQATSLLSDSTQDKRAGGGEEGTVLDRIRTKISRFLYVPLGEVDVEKAVNDYGIDSMIAAELRNWFFASFEKEVSLSKLLGATMTVQKLAEEADGQA